MTESKEISTVNPSSVKFNLTDLSCYEKNNTFWFRLSDIGKMLEVGTTTSTMWKDMCDEDEVEFKKNELGGHPIPYVSESALYRIINRSNSPKARPFERWVTKEVLPSIRKTGSYSLVETPEAAIAASLTKIMSAKTSDEEAKALLKECNKIMLSTRKLSTTVSVQSQQIAEMQPKVNYYNTVLQCKDVLPITIIAKDYGKSAIWMNQFLKDEGVQYKKYDTWFLYQKYAEQGYTKTKTNAYKDKDGNEHIKVHTYWTQEGRLFIYELMKKKNHLPLIEQE